MNYIEICGGVKPDYRTASGKAIKRTAIKTTSEIFINRVNNDDNVPKELILLRVKDIMKFRKIYNN